MPWLPITVCIMVVIRSRRYPNLFFRFDIDIFFADQKFSIRYRFDILLSKNFRFDIDSIFWYRKNFDSISIRYFDIEKFRFDIDSIFWYRKIFDSISIRYFGGKMARFDIDSILSNRNIDIPFDIDIYRRLLFAGNITFFMDRTLHTFDRGKKVGNKERGNHPHYML